MYQRERLFSRLGHFAYQSVVKATKLCRTFRHEYVELEHWLSVVLEQPNGDVPALLSHYGANVARLNEQLEHLLSHMPTRSAAAQDLSGRLELAVERGLLMSQVMDDSGSVRTVHILLGILQDSGMQRWLYRLSDEFRKLPIPQVMEEFADLLTSSVEHEEISLTQDVQVKPCMQENQAALEKWCSDLTQQAREGKIDPVIARDSELRQMVDILLRRRQNNPILVGEAGVGKTAVVEALACKIAVGAVPPLLKGARLLSLDLGRMQAGASMRGEFESRLKALIDAIAQSDSPVILFCDEAHTLVGAGGQAGTGDAVNLLKPMLARGSLRMIAATTWSEYKQFIEPDAALTRRFQRVLVGEPDEEAAVNMLRAIAPFFSRHHGVTIRDAAIRAAVRLSLRNLPSRQLPDKAISLLDTACARVSLSQHVTPQRIELLGAALNAQEAEIVALNAEIPLGGNVQERLGWLQQNVQHSREELKELGARREKEQQLVSRLQEAGRQENGPVQPALADLAALQDGEPLIHPWVDEQVVAEVLSDWTGIPSGRMIQDDLDNALQLELHLGARVFGQKAAVNEIAQAVRISRAGIQHPERPLGVFLLAGPTGTGKTETAAALAEAMYSGAHNLITFNMSEFQEAHTVSTLKGAPPGYVGYGKGGKLTEAVRRKPYSVILLDEFDKAHPDVYDLFYQVFDKGWMEDGEGRIISFRHCFILLTCNQGAEEIERALSQEPEMPLATLRPLVHGALQRKFAPALLARMSVIPYWPLDETALQQIACKHLAALQLRLKEDIGADFVFEMEVGKWVASRVCDHPHRGRAVEDLLRQTVLPAIGNELLRRKKKEQETKSIHLIIEGEELSMAFA
ncbi:protein disaggregation chaperone [Serratia ficaria]|uniref:type VI secretion system ATPase TssH n=1 Tax=Serratia ficaria TaxID=61651 RepID=UPI00217BD72D|nr:type VI secretion system ATPase TssH [Serratia ficaria]CAI1707240.1 protein disaggregation chaperone [Serratia ficaria]